MVRSVKFLPTSLTLYSQRIFWTPGEKGNFELSKILSLEHVIKHRTVVIDIE